ncbi:hypothetical protein [Glutamicibacter soli]
MSKHKAVTTQSQHPWRATIRTILAIVIALAAIAPVVYTAATMQSPELATGAAAAALTLAGAITRIMALPVVETFLQRFVPWLAAGARGDEPSATEIEVAGPATLDE